LRQNACLRLFKTGQPMGYARAKRQGTGNIYRILAAAFLKRQKADG